MWDRLNVRRNKLWEYWKSNVVTIVEGKLPFSALKPLWGSSQPVLARSHLANWISPSSPGRFWICGSPLAMHLLLFCLRVLDREVHDWVNWVAVVLIKGIHRISMRTSKMKFELPELSKAPRNVVQSWSSPSACSSQLVSSLWYVMQIQTECQRTPDVITKHSHLLALSLLGSKYHLWPVDYKNELNVSFHVPGSSCSRLLSN